MLSDSLTVYGAKFNNQGLNPCSGGLCSLTVSLAMLKNPTTGLNPCSGGLCSLTNLRYAIGSVGKVLILVLVDYAL